MLPTARGGEDMADYTTRPLGVDTWGVFAADQGQEPLHHAHRRPGTGGDDVIVTGGVTT